MSAFDIYPSRRNVPTEDIRVNAIVFPWRPRSREEEAAVQSRWTFWTVIDDTLFAMGNVHPYVVHENNKVGHVW